jgi:uncharacterized protein YjbI with pentapeptide repeats
MWLALGGTLALAVGGAAVVTWLGLRALHFKEFQPEQRLSAATLYDLLKIAFAVAVGIGGVVALVTSYRRQRIGEFAEQREGARLFNERFATAAGQLGDDRPAVRLAGVYAMASLADDWPERRHSCVDVLCAYLRMPYATAPDKDAPESEHQGFQAAREVRYSVIRIITAHLQSDDHRAYAAQDWCGLDLDFTGAVFDGGDFTGAQFTGGSISFTDVRFSGGTVDFTGAQFTGGTVSFVNARFCGGTVTFASAQFSGSRVHFNGTQFTGGHIHFVDARFSSGEVLFTGTQFCGSTVSFANAQFSGCTVDFSAEFSDGEVSFLGANFAGSTVDFRHARIYAGAADFAGAYFSRGTAGYYGATVWPVPIAPGPDKGEAPDGVMLPISRSTQLEEQSGKTAYFLG